MIHTKTIATHRVTEGSSLEFLMASPLLVAFAVLVLSNSDQYESASQYSSISMLCITAALTFTVSSAKTVGNVGMPDLVFGLICLVSYVDAIAKVNFDCALFTTALLISIVCIKIIASRTPYEYVVKLSIISYAAIIAVIVVFQGNELHESLDSANPLHWQSRFSPFEMHPNLVGVFFSVGAIVAAGALFMNFAWKVIGVPVMFGSVIFVLASSSRASLLALAVTAIVTAITMRSIFSTRQKTMFILGVAILFAVAVIFIEQISEYAVTQLELDSDTRGVDSGGSGRSELWAMGLNMIFSDIYIIVLGLGFRQANADIIGFSTENSFITIALESGIPLMLMFVSMLVIALRKSRQVAIKYKKGEYVICFAIITFMLVESVFNRYLLAIGNTASLILLFSVFCSYSWANSGESPIAPRRIQPRRREK